MSKRRVALIILLIAGLAACSADGPAQTEREHAFLQYVKDNGSDDARIEDFKSGKCTKAEGAPSYVCDVSAEVTAMGRKFGNEMDGVYTFSEVGGVWKVTGRVQ
ncbi:hypothetical protein LPY96_17615 [Xanthomonas citri pv. malvacearum]|uniref:hypothetical protein n=1 Tax=Xanthomonas TaxID=338 RepID=UPI0012A85509|nr:hypothetical protein [Xanthomonas citri]MCC4629159.1 hypothetical protein [Xanthomonas citri]NMI13270.1 hypothetical protein [Xanthomonas citri]QGL17186.1 hypothetical protein GH913_10525 [Xanthomonas citri pv. malvacearum]WAW86080.1 hypothetical protein LPY96_17615 [Xanthomonas citri pv. malvacearum]WAW90261.1 hypothetical protein LPY95_16450 [Xanthomonas citri pv. malvacearum]